VAGGRDKLSATKVACCTTPGYLLDGGGLYLQVTARASAFPGEKKSKPIDVVTKSWCFRYRDRVTSRLRELGLGTLLDVSLAEARVKAAEMRDLLRNGKDPLEERRRVKDALKLEKARRKTFDECAAMLIAIKRSELSNVKSGDQWENTLNDYASPFFGSWPVAEVNTAIIVKALSQIWTDKTETAVRVRGRIESVLDWATVSGLREGDNPARWRGHLEHLLPNPSMVQKKSHHPALPYAEIGEFTAALRAQAGISAKALEFAILTAARTGEVIGFRWEEFDSEKAIWTIPGERMKAGKEHTVPLSGRALEIVKELEKAKLGDFVFPGSKAKTPLSNMSMAMLVRRMDAERMEAEGKGWRDVGGNAIVPHGFRSTFRDWAGEMTNFPRDLIEACLAHQLKNKSEAAYARGTMPEKRRKVMEAWAKLCERRGALAANVVPIRAAL